MESPTRMRRNNGVNRRRFIIEGNLTLLGALVAWLLVNHILPLTGMPSIPRTWFVQNPFFFLLIAVIIIAVRRNLDLTREMQKRQEAEAIMHDRDTLFRSYFELGPIGKGITAADKTWVEVNDHLCQMFGYTRPELLAKTWAELTHPGDLASDVAHFDLMMRGQSEGYILDKRFLRHDGSVLYANIAVSCIRDAGGNVNHILATFLDVGERKRAEDRIRALSKALLQSQETERLRISRDLHDNVAQDLTSLKIAIEMLGQNGNQSAGELAESVHKLQPILQNTIDNVRDIAYNLRPPGLEALGLIRTMAQFCDDFKRLHKIDIDFDSAGLDFALLDAETEINIYRILQEALGNVRRHARATKAIVRLVASWPTIILRIQDNGCGFNTGDVLGGGAGHERHMGLRNMRERVMLLGGKCTFESLPGEGTRILIEIPQKEPENG